MRNLAMTVRPIRILGQPGDEVLRQPADPVTVIDGSVQCLIDDMLATVREAPGVGLAAPQVGVPLRIVVINVPEVPAFALLNGEVVKHSGRRWLEEGCLSIPGYRGELFRAVRVTVTGMDRKGRRIRIRAVDDLLAQALEHEIDHTNGILYIDHIAGDEHLHRSRARDDDELCNAEADAFERSEACGSDRRAEDLRSPLTPLRRRGRPPLLSHARKRRSSLTRNPAIAVRG
jgi:peptide deformylase